MRLYHLCVTHALFATIAAAAAGSCATPSEGFVRNCDPPSQSGIALLAVQWKRTLRAADSEAAEAPATSEDLAVAQVANASAAPNSSCTGGDCATALLATPEALGNVANMTPPGRREHSSYSLSAAGQGDGLSGSATAALRESELDNVSLPPISEESFEPFGYPGAGLLLELHMPEVTLKELHSSTRGSLAQFLLGVREQIGKAAKVKEERISVLGIHGRYKRYEDASLFHARTDRSSSINQFDHVDEEVVLRFEILPGWNDNSEPRQALSALKEELSSPNGKVMKGPLSTVLANATVTLSAPLTVASQPRMIEHRGVAHMSAMAWPIGISAAFIGILIWLAAY